MRPNEIANFKPPVESTKKLGLTLTAALQKLNQGASHEGYLCDALLII
jgi:hypothetical protein